MVVVAVSRRDEITVRSWNARATVEVTASPIATRTVSVSRIF